MRLEPPVGTVPPQTTSSLPVQTSAPTSRPVHVGMNRHLSAAGSYAAPSAKKLLYVPGLPPQISSSLPVHSWAVPTLPLIGAAASSRHVSVAGS